MFTNDDCDDDDANNSDDYVDETQGLNMNRSCHGRVSGQRKERTTLKVAIGDAAFQSTHVRL